jgi:hypothetical protein
MPRQQALALNAMGYVGKAAFASVALSSRKNHLDAIKLQ